MTSNEIRQKYLDFFKAKGHEIIPSAGLVPENDPTTLFISAGMQPLVPYLLGEKHSFGDKLVDVQKCIRTDDIDEVGDASHLTFFEMLGNWSLGSYFKNSAIEWSWEFLTDKNWLGLDPNKLAVSVFAGDEAGPRDNSAAEKWLEVSNGALKGRIDYLPKNKNWWGLAGHTGPCGPDTEIFYWIDSKPAPKEIKIGDLADHPNWLEIWNNVFMQYNKNIIGKYEPLAQKNVDTGMGLERITMVLQGKNNVFETDLFGLIIAKIEQFSQKKYSDDPKAYHIIADHIKASVFLIADGVAPSNTGRGYVLRRLIRRAIRYSRQLGIAKPLWMEEIAQAVFGIYKDVYQELVRNEKFIIERLNLEEEKFSKTLEMGLKEFDNLISKLQITNYKLQITSIDAFNLYQTYGFPIELTKELAKEKGLAVNEEGFNKEMKKHQDLSRTASAGMFKGGLADASEETIKLHTAAHLLLASLRKVLGDNVFQKGSNITAERLRFDFSHTEKMTDEQKQEVEKLVNDAIQKKLQVSVAEMTVEEAKGENAMGIFESKYGEKVKVYTIGQGDEIFSKEICGGPHVGNTGELGNFKIIKEEASSAGVRRIKGVLELDISKKIYII